MPSTVTDRLQGLTTSVAVKAPVLVASTGNLVLSSTQVIDGIAVVSSNRVLVKNQTDNTQNGIYVVDTSTWSRAKDFDGQRDAVRGTLVFVSTGTVSGGTWYMVSSTGINVPDGSSAINFAVAPGALGLKTPTVQAFLSGSGTYTTTAGVQYIQVELVGGGGGGEGSGSASRGAGGAGGNTTFGTALLTGNGGTGGGDSPSIAGGTATGGDVNWTGGTGGGVMNGAIKERGGNGGGTMFGPGGPGGRADEAAVAAIANTGGGGGGGGGGSTTILAGSGGGGGGYLRKIINAPNATYSYAVGAGGTAGTAGTSGFAGGAGGSGIIIVTEFYG